MPVYEHKGIEPEIGEGVFVAPSAQIIGDVKVGDGASIWYNAVLRGDIDSIMIGANTNVQDGVVVHVDWDIPCIVGESVTIGHNAVIHACTIEDACLVGMGAIVLSGAKVGEGSIIGAGAVITEGDVIPPRSLVLGIPGRVVKELDDKTVEGLWKWADDYRKIADEYLE